MFKKQWYFIISNFIFSFFFNILYYKLIKNWLHLFNIYKIYLLLNVSFFFKLKNGFYIFIVILFNIIFFIKHYLKFFYNIFLLCFIILNNNFILYNLTFFIKYNYIFKSQINLHYFIKYKKLISQYKIKKNKVFFNKLFLEMYFKHHIYYNVFYIYYMFLFIYNIVLINFILYIETLIVQWVSKSRKKVYALNFSYYINRFKFWKKEYDIKISVSFFFQRYKRLIITYYCNFINKIKYIFIYIKYTIICIIDPIIFQLLKNKGNLFSYYFFKILKFFKSFIKYIWESDIIYKFLKFIERKKWYIEEMHNRDKSISKRKKI